MKKTDGQIAAEVFESVKHSRNKQKRLLSSTFWRRFNVRRRTQDAIERVERIIAEQGLNIAVKANAPLGEENEHDWITLTLSLRKEENPFADEPPIAVPRPFPKQLRTMETREFESEREVEVFFLLPLLEELGYKQEDISVGYPVKMFKGVQRALKEADIVVFNEGGREQENILLIVEAKKKTIKGINADQIGQTRSYAQTLLPACYVVSDGCQVKVFKFNGMLAPDECVMDFDKSELRQKWEDFYRCASKEATCRRKKWMEERLKSAISMPTP